MSSINESISRCREILDYPLSNSPTLHRIYGALIRHIQNRFSELGNSGQAWAYATEQVTVVSGTDTYTLTATNFGKPLSLVTYSTDDGHFERSVDFFEVQNLTFNWNAPRNAATGYWATDSTSIHSAERVAIYRNAGTNTVKLIFRPLPKAGAVYTLLYSLGDWAASATLTDTPLLSEFHSMFEIPAALALLPSAKWSDDENLNISKRKQLAASLEFELGLFTPTWVTFTSDETHAKMGMRESCYDV